MWDYTIQEEIKTPSRVERLSNPSWELSKSWELAAAVSLLKTLPLIEGKGFTVAL